MKFLFKVHLRVEKTLVRAILVDHCSLKMKSTTNKNTSVLVSCLMVTVVLSTGSLVFILGQAFIWIGSTEI